MQQNSVTDELLKITARGSAILTEINRLVELIPRPFKIGDSYIIDKERQHRLAEITCDFSYFKSSDSFESRIESDRFLKKADEDFCEEYSEVLMRFYLTFESIQRYIDDLNRLSADLEDDLFVGQSFDSLLVSSESRQLVCEAYFNLGYMLLTVDNNFNGQLRERLIVAHYRYSSYKSSPDGSIDDTCNLLRSTGYINSARQQFYGQNVGSKGASKRLKYFRPPNYPENLFSRAQVNQSIVNLLIAKLQSVDIYNQTNLFFPHPDHRSTALSQQASMLYVLLYFCPDILKTQRARMREITDKFFYDNWIISLSMGELVNLIEAWEPYRVARESLTQIIDLESVRAISGQYSLRFDKAAKQVHSYTRPGWLDETSFLENHHKILNSIREGNVLLRWLLLHSRLEDHWQNWLTRTLHSVVVAEQPEGSKLCSFLQDLSNLEQQSSKIGDQMLENRLKRLNEYQNQALEILDELLSIYTEEKPMRWVKTRSNSNLAQILAACRASLQETKLDEESSRETIIRLINSLEASRESYSDGKSLQIVQLFSEIKQTLSKVLRYLSLSEDMRLIIQSISDFSYSWGLFDDKFTQYLQQIIEKDPMKTRSIEAIFLKLASASDTQLLRIQQVGAQADLVSVSQYYSCKLVAYIREVLHVIPATILKLIGDVIELQTNNSIGNMPTRIALDNLRDYVLQEQRSKMLELTYKISHYAEGMMLMQSTTIGLIRLNSRQLLEDGIRRELVRKLSDSIHTVLDFSTPIGGLKETLEGKIDNDPALVNGQLVQQANSMLARLSHLTSIIDGYKRSFEYIQDYLLIYGLRMWQEESSRLVKFHVEQAVFALADHAAQFGASNPLGRTNESLAGSTIGPTVQYHSRYQSSKIPIPVYDNDPVQSSFIIRILDELLRITSPKVTVYDEQTSAWYDQRSMHRQVVDLKLFQLIHTSLSVAGLSGLDELCCGLLALELQRLHSSIVELSSGQHKSNICGLLKSFRLAADEVVTKSRRNNLDRKQLFDCRRTFLRNTSGASNKIMQHGERLLSQLTRIGQLQAIRMNINSVLSAKSRYDARHLYDCLDTLNETLTLTLMANSMSIDSLGEHGKKRQNQQKNCEATGNKIAEQHSFETSNGKLDSSMEPDSQTVQEAQHNSTSTSSTQRLAPISIDNSETFLAMANYLGRIGLQNPMDKIYTLNLGEKLFTNEVRYVEQVQNGGTNEDGIDVIFLLLVALSPKYTYSRSVCGLLPAKSQFNRLTGSFGEQSFDCQPLFYGITTLLNHYEPMIDSRDNPKFLDYLLSLTKLYISCTIGCTELDGGLSLATDNVRLMQSISELYRLSRQKLSNKAIRLALSQQTDQLNHS